MCSRETLEAVLYFDTVQLVTVHSFPIGVLHRSFQLAVILYIAIYSLYLQKGYQEYSTVKGVIYTKVKGLAYADHQGEMIVYDANDLVYPPVETNALFITTAFISTTQSRGNCSSTIKCSLDGNCTNTALETNGALLPICDSSGHCLMNGWCPLENDTITNDITMIGWENFTVFVRSSVLYEKFGIFRSDPSNPVPGRNLFTVRYMLGNTPPASCSLTGCIISGDVDWTCDLDKEDSTCQPRISFTTIPGTFNFRYKAEETETERALRKVYGIRVLLRVKGEGGKFSFFQMVITIGASAAFLGVCTVLVDLLMLFVSDSKYYTKKFEIFEKSNENK